MQLGVEEVMRLLPPGDSEGEPGAVVADTGVGGCRLAKLGFCLDAEVRRPAELDEHIAANSFQRLQADDRIVESERVGKIVIAVVGGQRELKAWARSPAIVDTKFIARVIVVTEVAILPLGALNIEAEPHVLRDALSGSQADREIVVTQFRVRDYLIAV